MTRTVRRRLCFRARLGAAVVVLGVAGPTGAAAHPSECVTGRFSPSIVWAFGDAPTCSVHSESVPEDRALVGVAIVGHPGGNGYWIVTSDGIVVPTGDARGFGPSTSVSRAPIVGIAATPSGNGYWLVAADGGVFAFGDAGFFGSLGGVRLQAPVVGVAATPSGNGYWLVAADGGVFAFGDAPFAGSIAGDPAFRTVGIAAAGSPTGAWLAVTCPSATCA